MIRLNLMISIKFFKSVKLWQFHQKHIEWKYSVNAPKLFNIYVFMVKFFYIVVFTLFTLFGHFFVASMIFLRFVVLIIKSSNITVLLHILYKHCTSYVYNKSLSLSADGIGMVWNVKNMICRFAWCYETFYYSSSNKLLDFTSRKNF